MVSKSCYNCLKRLLQLLHGIFHFPEFVFVKLEYSDKKHENTFYALFIDSGVSVKGWFTKYCHSFRLIIKSYTLFQRNLVERNHLWDSSFFSKYFKFYVDSRNAAIGYRSLTNHLLKMETTIKQICTCKMCQKQLWESDISSKDASQLPASLIKVSFFQNDFFSYILLV